MTIYGVDMPQAPLLAAVKTKARKARKAALAVDELHEAIRAAVAGGCTLRAVGDAAGLSHVRVLKIVQAGSE